MKYVFFIIFGLLFVGCGDDSRVKTSDGSPIGYIRKIEFEGHTYLVRDNYHTGGICHDENCKCKKMEVK